MGIKLTPAFFTKGGHKGFQMTFANGWTVSVQFGPGNYCEHYSKDLLIPVESSKDAEVYRWDANGNSPEQPKGRCTMEEVAKYIAETASF